MLVKNWFSSEGLPETVITVHVHTNFVMVTCMHIVLLQAYVRVNVLVAQNNIQQLVFNLFSL